jgi:hypothetical protein
MPPRAGALPSRLRFADEVTSCTMHSALSRHQAECKNPHIQALKKKHGIRYDTHASYRFVEKKSRRARK